MELNDLFGSEPIQDVSLVDESVLSAGEISSDDMSLDAGGLGGFEFGSGIEVRESSLEKPEVSIVKFAHEQMLQGKMGSELVGSIKSRYGSDTLAVAKDQLVELAKQEGIVGTIVVDASEFESCKEAMTHTKNSPYKNSLKFIKGCKCAHHEVADYENSDYLNTNYEANFDNAIDNYFDDVNYEAKTVRICKSTGLRVFAGYGDLDSEDLADGFTEGINIDDGDRQNMPKPEKKAKESSLQFVQRCFKESAMSKTRSLQIAVPPEDIAKHTVDQGELHVEIIKEKKAGEEVIVDPVNHAADQEIELFSSLNEFDDVSTDASEIVLGLDNPFSSIDIEEQAK
jgi:hypothetical protein